MIWTKPLRLAANLSTLFQELPFERRAVKAAACGFSGLEMQFPLRRLRRLRILAGVDDPRRAGLGTCIRAHRLMNQLNNHTSASEWKPEIG